MHSRKSAVTSDPRHDAHDFRGFPFYADFGRYEGSRDAPPPRHTFLIGRERERAHFLDLLYMKSGLGSYLVTGVRGVGKTSFVWHCLETYVRDVYERYSRSMVGRNSFDKLCLVLGLAFPAFLVVCATPVIGEYWDSPHTDGPLALIAMTALTALAITVGLGPLWLVHHTRRALTSFDGSIRNHRRWLAVAFLSFSATCAVTWTAAQTTELTPRTLHWLCALNILLLGYKLHISQLSKRASPDGLQHTPHHANSMLLRAKQIATLRALALSTISASLTVPLLVALVGPRFGRQWQPVDGWPEELCVSMLCAITAVLVTRIEKLGLLQPTRRMVFETAIHPPTGGPQTSDLGKNGSNAPYRIARCVEATLFYTLYRHWLPVLRVRINLGLDRLTHAHIIESMMRGLLAQLIATFADPRGVLSLIKYALGILAWTLLMHLHQPNLLSTLGRSDLEPFLTVPRPFGTADSSRLCDFLLPDKIDLLWGSAVWLLLAIVSRQIHFLPHRRACRELSALLDSLSSHVSVQEDGAQGKLAHAAGELAFPVRRRTVSTAPRDPHALEQTFLATLQMLRRPTQAILPGIRFSLPAPETIFVFDELDKVGTTTTLLHSDVPSEPGHSRDAERDRSRKLQALLSDLKNLLGTAQARFVFVGGRNLHDEWLADEVNRQPLLSNIFDAEIYVRSLLTDHGQPTTRTASVRPFTLSVQRYFDAQRWRARVNWEQWKATAGAGSREYGLEIFQPSFLRGTMEGETPLPAQPPLVLSRTSGVQIEVPNFEENFVRFLTFRSRGIPRRARLTLESFVRPYDRINENPTEDRPAQHVLYFEDEDRHRIELISELYGALAPFPSALAWRDDKVLMAVFQFADFLTRFHRRAFSLQSLERFEELMHIHRAPDTSVMAARLIAHWSGQLLEWAAAGIHTYRFRSEWAGEIAYLSTTSQHESASANFTLDEAQALKSQLGATLVDVREDGSAFEVHTALAELHDLDGDHLDARHHFRRAIEILDKRLQQEFVDGGKDGEGAVARLLDTTKSRPDQVERQLDWALARLRVMLQLGLTYERTFDYQRAGLEYGNARQIARTVFVSWGKRQQHPASGTSALLEPIFAQAWAVMKDPTVTQSPFNEGCAWLCDTLLPDPAAECDDVRTVRPEGAAPENDPKCWVRVRRCAERETQWSRELNMLGDLGFFYVPQELEHDKSLNRAIEAYSSASEIARRVGDTEQQARSALSLSLCHLLENAGSENMSPEKLGAFAEQLHRARQFARDTPSGQGPFSDSMSIHHLGLELTEELEWLARVRHGSGSRIARDVEDSLAPLRKPYDVSSHLSPLRQRMVTEALWRLSQCQGLPAQTHPRTPPNHAFPARSRILNLRSQILAKQGNSDSFQELVRVWRRFDNRGLLAPCRIALASPSDDTVADLWRESNDVATGGKHYFAWLRDRYYLEDGYGPMLVRANFAVTVGFRNVHRAISGQ